jgi:hypothetical protein
MRKKMRKIQNFIEKHGLLVSLVLMIVAVLTGGSGICLADGAAVVDPDPTNPDPVNPEVNDMGDPTGEGAGQTLPGTQASGTQIRRGDLAEG